MRSLEKQFHRRASATAALAIYLVLVLLVFPANAKIIKRTATKINVTQSLSIGKIRALPKAIAVQTEGNVTSLPNILGKGIFYIQDANAGIQILLVKGDAPQLNAGDRVRVTGKTSVAGGESHIRVASSSDFRRIGTGNAVQPKRVPISQIKDSGGLLVTAEGTVIEKRGQTIVVGDATSSVKALLKRSAPFSKNTYVKGQRIAMTGIVSRANDEMRLLPRSDTDIVAEKIPDPTPVSRSGARPTRSQSLSETALTILLALTGIIGGFFMQRRG